MFWVLLPAALLTFLLLWTWRALPGRGETLVPVSGLQTDVVLNAEARST